MFSSNGTFYLAATTSGGEQYAQLGQDEEGTAHGGSLPIKSLVKDEVRMDRKGICQIKMPLTWSWDITLPLSPPTASS